MQRQTQDIDLAIAVPDWEGFEELRSALLASGCFAASPHGAYRLRHANGWPIDLLPFGGVESSERMIAWPPNGDVVMGVFGFREALASAQAVRLPAGVLSRVVSLPALAVLKIMCWQDRHYTSPRKDAYDLQMVLRHYLLAGNEARLWQEFANWTQEYGFDYELAGPRMLGHDMRQMLGATGFAPAVQVLQNQSTGAQAGLLAYEMNSHDPDRAVAWLNALQLGLQADA